MSKTKDQKAPQTFYLYRYQLHIEPQCTKQLPLNGSGTTEKELYLSRSEIIRRVICALPERKIKNAHTYKIEYKSDDGTQYIISAEAQRVKHVTQEKVDISVDHQPYAWIAIDTDPDVQVIAIAAPRDLRQDHVASRLTQTLQTILNHSELMINVNRITNDGSFWEYVKKNKESIRKVCFRISPPNMAGLSDRLSVKVPDFYKKVGAQKGSLDCIAPRNKSLILDENNTELKGMVEYTQEGGGECIFCHRGDNKQHNLSNQQKSIVGLVYKDNEDLFIEALPRDREFILTSIRQECRIRRQ